MKGIRFFAALYAAKLATVALSVMHRNGTHMPGVLAMKICPTFSAEWTSRKQSSA